MQAPSPEQIGEWLKNAREKQGRYSQEQAAPLIGTTTRTLGGWERGETVPPADQLLAAARLYGADIAALSERGVTRAVAPKLDVPDPSAHQAKGRRKKRGA